TSSSLSSGATEQRRAADEDGDDQSEFLRDEHNGEETRK
ncbi:uncharacterized, partial [Tachysurus ichikawai]